MKTNLIKGEVHFGLGETIVSPTLFETPNLLEYSLGPDSEVFKSILDILETQLRSRSLGPAGEFWVSH